MTVTVPGFIWLTSYGGRSGNFYNASRIQKVSPGNKHYDRFFRYAEGPSPYRVGSLVLFIGDDQSMEFDQTPEEIMTMLGGMK